MKLDFKTYKDKVTGCWAGKNIGGVLGAPFEGKRGYVDVEFYAQDLSAGPPPNDDLDLQIIWLAAVERYGRNVNASILADYWLSYVVPNWCEYGKGKSNLKAGLAPPMSGEIDNVYKDSCGCFIRSEIWACLAPGNPSLAARYAYEDAIVDHSGEGMYGEIFCAALQSAAFTEGDTRKLLSIGLSYIPADCAVARCVKRAIACYDNGDDIKKARRAIHIEAPGTFGLQIGKLSGIPEYDRDMPLGEPGYDAPENIGFLVAGWLYGEGDFGKSLCSAVACGEDTDCTAATLGAILGIIAGASGLPEKWTAPLGDKIATMCIDKTSAGIWVPDTVTELADRVMRAAPLFMGGACDIFAEGGYALECLSGNDLYCSTATEYLKYMNGMFVKDEMPVSELCALSPYVQRQEYPTFTMFVDGCGSASFTRGEDRTLKVTLYNARCMMNQLWARVTLYTPPGVTLVSSDSYLLSLNNLIGSKTECSFTFNADSFPGPKLEVLVDVAIEGRHSTGACKVVLTRC